MTIPSSKRWTRSDAVEIREIEEGHLAEYQNRDARWEAAKAGHCYCNVESWKRQRQEERSRELIYVGIIAVALYLMLYFASTGAS